MSKIQNIEKNNRPREKALINGISSLSDKELLALIIRCGTKNESAIDIAGKILTSYESLSNLLNSDLYNLMKIKGIKKAKAIELMAVLEIAKRASKEEKRKLNHLKSAADVYNFLKLELENEKQEHFIAIFLNTRLSIIKKETLFIGGEYNSMVDVNFMFKQAVSCGARKIICVHNHPSGDSTPSKEDLSLTKKIIRVGEIVNIELLDHIIIGKNNYFSINSMLD